MSQTENPKTTNPKKSPVNKTPKTPRVSKAAKETTPEPADKNLQCHIHNKFDDWDVDGIREKVCVPASEFPLREFEGKHYCLFHYPSKDKGAGGQEKFEEIFKERLETIDKQCAEIEAEFPDDQESQIKAKLERKIQYDFRYVWFSQTVNDFRRTFKTKADFRSATFTGYAEFSQSTFLSGADFRWVKFSSYASFSSAKFSSYASFISATFSSNAIFNSATFFEAIFSSAKFSAGVGFISAVFSSFVTFRFTSFSFANFSSTLFLSKANFKHSTFSSEAIFKSAVFESGADFKSAVFSGDGNFNQTKFSKNAQTNFNKTKFEKEIFFDRTRFRSDVLFNSTIFEKDGFFRGTFFVKDADFRFCKADGYLTFEKIRQGNENTFDFQKTYFEKAKRVSFHTCSLRPSWFINVDSREFVFIDVDWRKSVDWSFSNENIKTELEGLEKRGIKDQKKRLLEIACRQLAVNAEENNRYEEASRFRYMAMETRRLENKGIWRFLNLHWFYKWTSGYGESWSRAVVVLLGVLFLFGVLYAMPFAKFDYGEKKREISADAIEQQIYDVSSMGERYRDMTIWEGLVHSPFVAALQRPEPKPADTLTKFFVIMETIFAPLQAALLALAIRRKFMR